MTDLEIKDFMRKWGLSPTETAFILGVSHNTLANARRGARLSEKTYEKMLSRRLGFETKQAEARANKGAA